MFYVYIIALLFIALLVLKMFLRNKDEDDHNLMEDVPTISINKEELEKHAVQISQYYSSITTRSNCESLLLNQ